MTQFNALQTEKNNETSKNIDKMSALEIARCINEQDKTVAFAVEKELDDISACMEIMAEVLRKDGKVFYVGAGTSGRLGVLDASECPPTYGVSAEIVQGILAGGDSAAFKSIEDAEDDLESIVNQMKSRGFSGKDLCVAISASGSANCVKGALAYAKEIGARTICVTCNKNSDLIGLCEKSVAVEAGAEVINGSTRMKAGTAQKMVLNMLSTGAMVLNGRVRGNYMAYMVPSNVKLVDRAIRIICDKTGVSREVAERELAKADNKIYLAIDAIEG